MARSKASMQRAYTQRAQQRQSKGFNEAEIAVQQAEAADIARGNGMDLSRLGMETNWAKVTRVAVNPYRNKSWNSYAKTANERLKRVERNTGVKTDEFRPNYKPNPNRTAGMKVYHLDATN